MSEQDKALCFFTEYPCNNTECSSFAVCEKQYRENYNDRSLSQTYESKSL